MSVVSADIINLVMIYIGHPDSCSIETLPSLHALRLKQLMKTHLLIEQSTFILITYLDGLIQDYLM